MAAQAPTQETATELVEANAFQLRCGKERFVFNAQNLIGQSQLSYDDGSEQRTYTGDEIRREETAVGVLLTVETSVIFDGPTDTVTLVLPQVLLEFGKPEKVSTFAVYTHTAGSIAGRPLNAGQVETYAVKTFRGTARFVLT